MLRRTFLIIAAGLLLGITGTAQAQGKKVAVIPVTVVKGAAANSAVVTEAISDSLEQRGYQVSTVGAAALRRHGAGGSKVIPIATLARLREQLGVDYVVYTRVLSVGQGVNAESFQANTIVNVMG